MVSSGTFAWAGSFAADDFLNEAFERIGMDPARASAWQLDSARRSMQLVFVDWSNRPINLWQVVQTSTALSANQASVTLNSYDLFVAEAATRTTSGGVNNDLIISPISRSEYLALPNKAQTGQRPTQFYLDRLVTPIVYLWPVPQATGVTLLLNIMRFNEDVGNYSNTIATPQRWYEALIAGIAYRLAQKYAPDRLADTKQAYEDAYFAAATEDTENVPMRLVPDVSGRRLA